MKRLSKKKLIPKNFSKKNELKNPDEARSIGYLFDPAKFSHMPTAQPGFRSVPRKDPAEEGSHIYESRIAALAALAFLSTVTPAAAWNIPFWDNGPLIDSYNHATPSLTEGEHKRMSERTDALLKGSEYTSSDAISLINTLYETDPKHPDPYVIEPAVRDTFNFAKGKHLSIDIPISLFKDYNSTDPDAPLTYKKDAVVGTMKSMVYAGIGLNDTEKVIEVYTFGSFGSALPEDTLSYRKNAIVNAITYSKDYNRSITETTNLVMTCHEIAPKATIQKVDSATTPMLAILGKTYAKEGEGASLMKNYSSYYGLSSALEPDLNEISSLAANALLVSKETGRGLDERFDIINALYHVEPKARIQDVDLAATEILRSLAKTNAAKGDGVNYITAYSRSSRNPSLSSLAYAAEESVLLAGEYDLSNKSMLDLISKTASRLKNPSPGRIYSEVEAALGPKVYGNANEDIRNYAEQAQIEDRLFKQP